MFTGIVIVSGALLVFLTAALRTWGGAYLRTAVVHDTAQHSEALVADGPFRYTRNPLYLANLPMAAEIGVLASRSGFIFLVLATWIFVYRLIFREEESLLKTQGESYRAYCQAVPRFWPPVEAARSVRKPAARLGSGFRRRELCLVIRSRRIVDRSDLKSTHRCRGVPARVRRAFSNHAKRIVRDSSRFVVNITACHAHEMQRVMTLQS